MCDTHSEALMYINTRVYYVYSSRQSEFEGIPKADYDLAGIDNRRITINSKYPE